MKQYFKSLGLTLVTAGLFLGLLISLHFLFNNYYVADQFQEKLIKIDGVKNVEVEDQKIILTMNHVGNLRKSYGEITNVIDDKKYQIIIKDAPSKKLEKISEESEVALQEGVIRGNFTEMSHYIKSIAQNQGAAVKIFVDDERVYLQLEDQNKFIYRIIERTNTRLPELAG